MKSGKIKQSRPRRRELYTLIGIAIIIPQVNVNDKKEESVSSSNVNYGLAGVCVQDSNSFSF